MNHNTTEKPEYYMTLAIISAIKILIMIMVIMHTVQIVYTS